MQGESEIASLVYWINACQGASVIHLYRPIPGFNMGAAVMKFLFFFNSRGSPEDAESVKVVSSGDSTRPVPALDKEKNIAFLLKELDSLRDLNKKVNTGLDSRVSLCR